MMRAAVGAAIVAAALAMGCAARTPPKADAGPVTATPASRLMAFDKVTIKRVQPEGIDVAADLFIPRPQPDGPPPPWPAVVISHGFSRSKERMRGHAEHLVSRGFVVLVPNSPGWFGGQARERNVSGLRSHVAWLAESAALRGDALEGHVDPTRIALVGYSAGGAVSFEAATPGGGGTTPVAALCLLDGVPWDRTLAAADHLPAIPFISLRAEPSSCNAGGAVRELLARVRVPWSDVLLLGANHCDAESPSDAVCAWACARPDPARQERFRRLMHLFLCEVLAHPALGDGGATTLQGELDALAAQGLVTMNEPAPPR